MKALLALDPDGKDAKLRANREQLQRYQITIDLLKAWIKDNNVNAESVLQLDSHQAHARTLQTDQQRFGSPLEFRAAARCARAARSIRFSARCSVGAKRALESHHETLSHSVLLLATVSRFACCRSISSPRSKRSSSARSKILSDDLQTTASARADCKGLGADGDDPYARALQARRLQIFYQDDLDAARAQGCIGERNDGRVEALACGGAASLPTSDRLVRTENAAREALVAYALERDPQLGPQDRAQLWRAYHKARALSRLVKPGTPAVQRRARTLALKVKCSRSCSSSSRAAHAHGPDLLAADLAAKRHAARSGDRRFSGRRYLLAGAGARWSHAFLRLRRKRQPRHLGEGLVERRDSPRHRSLRR